MITFLARVPSLWTHVFLFYSIFSILSLFLAGFAVPNKQFCMRYIKKCFYGQILASWLKGGFTLLTYFNWEPMNLCSKAIFLKANTGALSSSFFSKAVSIFPMDIYSLSLSSLSGLVTDKFQKTLYNGDKLTYLDIRYQNYSNVYPF